VLNVEARVVDDEMNDVPPGKPSEIVCLGPPLMKEHWNKTAEAFRGGWFHSGISSGTMPMVTLMSSTGRRT
jgi:fatty-acyl-CoA synthase